MQCALGLDFGTTSLSVVAVSVQGELLARRSVANPGHLKGLPAGHAEQDPHAIRSAGFTLLRDLVSDLPANPVCLGLTGQMHGGLLFDRRRRPLTSLISWQDRRANERTPGQPLSLCEQFVQRCPADAVARSGCTPSAGYLGVTLFALNSRQEMPANATGAAVLADWMAAELTDGEVVTDRTNAASTGLYDTERERWSDELIAAAGARPGFLPGLRPSGAVMGLVAPEIAVETGLASGLPVCTAIGDNQAAVLGSAPADRPTIQINIGTGGQINWPVERFLRCPGMDTRPLPADRYMLVGAGLAGGDAFAWVRRTAQAWLAAFGGAMEEEAVYARLCELAAAAPPDADGLRCEPLFRGTRQRPDARGAFSGVTNDNFTPGHVARAVLQGLADGMRQFYDRAGAAQPSAMKSIVGSGNGLRKNPLLVQILATTFGRDVWLPAHVEEAAFGAALLAGATVGLWPSLAKAGQSIELRKAASP